MSGVIDILEYWHLSPYSIITKEEQADLSKAVRELVMRGRVLLAVEK